MYVSVCVYSVSNSCANLQDGQLVEEKENLQASTAKWASKIDITNMSIKTLV